MASVTLQVGAFYAAGDTVAAYAASDWDPATPPSGAPPGSSVTTAVVAASGTLTFTGLTEGVDYYAYKSTGHPPYVRFRVDQTPGGSQDAIYVQPASGVTFPVGRETVSTATQANVASSATAVTLQAANTARKGWTVFNDSTQILYVKFGSAASATSYIVQMAAGSYYEMPAPVYTGIITGIWASANGNARVTELA